jgi:hypothetical protein
VRAREDAMKKALGLIAVATIGYIVVTRFRHQLTSLLLRGFEKLPRRIAREAQVPSHETEVVHETGGGSLEHAAPEREPPL